MGASSYTQGTSALFSIDTPLGTDKLLLKGFKGSEGISRLFHFDLSLLSDDDSIDYTKIIGKTVTITLNQGGGTPRYISGVISRFGQGGSGSTLTSYYAEMVPWLWFLTRTADCRIFQSMTIPDIILQVFNNLSYQDYSNNTKASYATLDYCVQYRETAFNFVSRLMEEYGIYYFFQHEQGKHTLVLADDSSAVVECPGQSSFQVDFENTANPENDVITGWRTEYEMRTGKYTLTDYNFTTPSTSLVATTNTIDSIGGNTSLETFDYPGKYATYSDGQTLAKTRMEEEEALYNVSRGTSNARSLATGCKFTLTGYYHDATNDTYLLTDIEHNASTDTYDAGKSLIGERYSNSFRCIPSSVTYRPPRVTPRPTITGPQPAIVVGPSGEEIYTDKYGRIKVQFYWDRKGSNDEKSSCWIRVSHPLAGKNWGAIFLPRIGHEVLVDFLEGDPDQPVITGRVYNAENMPPATLPDNMNVSGIKTHSTKGGSTDERNAIAFTDTKGSEGFEIYAQKDMIVDVQNNQTITVTNDRTETVTKGNESVEIKQGNRTHTIDQGNETLTVKQGNRVVEVDTGDDTLTVKTGNRVVNVNTGNDTHTIKTGNRSVEVSTGNDDLKVDMGNRSVTVSMGNDSLTINMGNQSTTLSLGSSSTSALQGITLTCGENSIQISPTGITISGMTVSISGQVQTQVSGLMTQVSGSAMLQLSGGITMIG